jgi:DHA1 family tetracycline resistance protein-like MFS transporter
MADLAAPEPQPDAPYRAPPPKGALAIIFIIVLADMMGFGVIIPLLPFYAKRFDASDFQVGLIFSIYSACQMIGSPILGLLSDRFGRRPVLVLSLLGSVSGYAILALATYVTWANPWHGLLLVYLSRFIDGFTGGNISTAQAYISDVTAPQQRAKAMGMLGAAFGIGFSIGPGVGGLLGHYHPSWPAVAAAGLGLFAAVMTYLRLPESRHHEPSAEGELWLHPSRFVPILRSPPLVQMMLIAFFSMMAYVMLEAVFALFLKDTFGYGPREVGWFFAFVGATIILVQGVLIGRLTARFGEWALVITGPLLVTGAMAMYVEAVLHPLVWLVILAGLFNACGRSLQMPTLSSLISQHSDPSMQGTVFGLHHMLGSLARVIGPAIAAAVYTGHHTAPFIVAGSITLAVALWTIWLRTRESPEVTRAFSPRERSEHLVGETDPHGLKARVTE